MTEANENVSTDAVAIEATKAAKKVERDAKALESKEIKTKAAAVKAKAKAKKVAKAIAAKAQLDVLLDGMSKTEKAKIVGVAAVKITGKAAVIAIGVMLGILGSRAIRS